MHEGAELSVAELDISCGWCVIPLELTIQFTLQKKAENKPHDDLLDTLPRLHQMKKKKKEKKKKKKAQKLSSMTVI